MEVVTTDMVSSQLTRILSSSQLSGSNVLSEFLSFIVHETLEGRGHELKEYTIGVNALRKEPDFNPQLDSIVRIHAGRLRRALKEYYYEEGLNDPILIAIPKGSYVPVFEPRSADGNSIFNDAESDKKDERPKDAAVDLGVGAEHFAFNYRPSIAVLPFRKNGNADSLEYFVKSIGEFLCTELTHFDNLKVMSYYSADIPNNWPSDIRKIGKLLEADYVFTGSIHELKGDMHVFVQLNCCETGDQLWAQTFDKSNTTENVWNFQTHVIETVLAAIAGLNGVISRHEMKKHGGVTATFSGGPSLAYWYYRFVESFDTKTAQEAKRFYEKVVKSDPSNATAMAFLSSILASETFVAGYNPRKDNHGILYAKNAIKIDPFCQHAYQALALHLLVHHNIEECIRTLEQGLEVNPKSAEYRGGMASLLIYAGSFEAGVKMLDKVVKLNPYMPWWHTMSYSYYSFYRDFYADALFWSNRIKTNAVWIPIVKAASFAQLDQLDKAFGMVEDFKTFYPSINLNDREHLRNLFFSDVLVQKLESGLKKIL